MRYLFLLFSQLALLASVLTAQSPLTTTFISGAGGAAGGATYVELEVLDPNGLAIDQVDLNLAPAFVGQPASLDVYLQPLTAPGTLDVHGEWIGPVANASVASSNPQGTPTAFVLSQPIELGAGCRFGVAFVCDVGHKYVTTQSSGLGLVFQTNELALTACCASNTPFAGAVFVPRIVNTNIHYSSGGTCPDIAACDPVGAGCTSRRTSFYELLAAAAFDLGGRKLVGTATANGYDVTLTTGTGFTPSPMATALAIGDDDVFDTASVGGTLGIHVGSNCWLATGPGNSSGFVPDSATMLGNPATGVYSWTDFDPTDPASGQVYYLEIGTLAIVTYDGVFGWGTSDPNEVEIRFDTATGDFSIEWGATAASNPEDWLVGYSPGGASLDPGNTDLSVTAPFSTDPIDIAPLALACIQRPVQDPNIPVAFAVETRDLEPNAQIHLGMIGFAAPPIGLAPLTFPADCTLYLSPITSDAQVLAPGATAHVWSPITLPPQSAALHAGFAFRVQAATLATGNGFLQSRTSNALDCLVGTL